MRHNWSATKQRLHPQSVAEIGRHSVLSGDRIRQCETSSGSCHKDTDQYSMTRSVARGLSATAELLVRFQRAPVRYVHVLGIFVAMSISFCNVVFCVADSRTLQSVIYTSRRRPPKKIRRWLSDEAVTARRLRRRLERQWRSTGSDTDRVKYRQACRQANRLIESRTIITSSVESKLLLATGNNAGESLNFCILVTRTKLELIPKTHTHLNHLLTISL